MPQRFLRPGITTSDCWNSCSWIAQSLYIRLITLVDDYGRYDGRIPIIHGHCFPLRSDVKPQQTAALVKELSDNGLAELYQVEGKNFIQLLKWHERARGESKYPDPKSGQILRNAADSCQILPPESSPLAISHKPESYVDEVVETWNSIGCFPKCLSVTDKRIKQIKARLSERFFKEQWKTALEKLKDSPFCTGKNDRGWKADIDWFLKPDSVPKIMEGKYDSKPINQNGTHSIKLRAAPQD